MLHLNYIPFSKMLIKAYRILCMQFLMSCMKAKINYLLYNWKILKILSQKMMTVGFYIHVIIIYCYFVIQHCLGLYDKE